MQSIHTHHPPLETSPKSHPWAVLSQSTPPYMNVFPWLNLPDHWIKKKVLRKQFSIVTSQVLISVLRRPHKHDRQSGVLEVEAKQHLGTTGLKSSFPLKWYVCIWSADMEGVHAWLHLHKKGTTNLCTQKANIYPLCVQGFLMNMYFTQWNGTVQITVIL